MSSSHEENYKTDAIFGTVVTGCIILAIIYMATLVRRSNKLSAKCASTPNLKKCQNISNVYERFKKYLSGSFDKITIGLIIAFLIADVVSAFNSTIMYPLIKASFPNQIVWDEPIALPRGAYFYPAQFFQAFLAFIFTLILLFFIIEGLTRLYIKFGTGIVNGTFVFLFIALFVSIFIWNIVDGVTKTQSTSTSSSAVSRVTQLNIWS